MHDGKLKEQDSESENNDACASITRLEFIQEFIKLDAIQQQLEQFSIASDYVVKALEKDVLSAYENLNFLAEFGTQNGLQTDYYIDAGKLLINFQRGVYRIHATIRENGTTTWFPNFDSDINCTNFQEFLQVKLGG